ncbi:hypothetical protein ABEB36_013050 [Hypothenemus hampei]|uniref:Uncharacterized protein n=1 Tax=Hypothenemus hampei TaxID=57062 RepID=A0ABD1E7I7_HYPHA
MEIVNIYIVSLLLTTVMVLISTQPLPNLTNTSGHEIVDGNCTNVTATDRVYYDHVDKAAIPLIIRSEDVHYRGDSIIYCIQALNQKNEETGGTSNITSGGVGHSYVDIDLESYRSHGLEFYVSIYASNHSHADPRLL